MNNKNKQTKKSKKDLANKAKTNYIIVMCLTFLLLFKFVLFVVNFVTA